MAASFRSDSPAATARSASPSRDIPSDETIEQVIQQATANARAANGGRSPVIGRDTRTQLFVGNLPYRVRWQDLKDLFRKAGGTVLRADVSLGPDNRSRGYGTVLLASAEDAGRAIDMFNGYVWQTRTLEVRPDRLPNDFDLSAAAQIGKLPTSQVLPYATATTATSSTFSYAMPAPQASVASTVIPAAAAAAAGLTAPLTQAHNALSLTQQGLSLSSANATTMPDPMVYPDSARSSLLGDISRSPTAFKAPSASSKPVALPDALAPSVATSSFGQSSLPVGATTSHDASTRTVHITNWPSQYNALQLEQEFQSIGKIIKVEVRPPSRLESKCHAFVIYSSDHEAKQAVAKYNGVELLGRALVLQIGNGDQLLLSQPPANAFQTQRAEEMPSAVTATSTATATVSAVPGAPLHPAMPTQSENPYSYGYFAMSPPMASGYVVASPPGSPYEQYPPPMAYLPIAASPSTAYPPPLGANVYGYSTWHHPPSPTRATNGNAPPSAANATTAQAATAAGTSSTGPTASTGSLRNPPPGTISLPGPGLGAFPQPQLSPMHGLPPITPSIPSFRFMQPLPTPPVQGPFASMGAYSPVTQAPPGFYSSTSPYFNLSPGPTVHYHRDANAIANNGVIGSGVGMLPSGLAPSSMMGSAMINANGQVTPYFDLTAATVGSEAPDYFPPMPITASLTGALQTMNLGGTSLHRPTASLGGHTSSASEGSIKGGSGSDTTASKLDEEPQFLEPVGVGRDGFPTLSARPESIPDGPNEGVSRTGLTDWVTTPEDLPNNASIKSLKQSPPATSKPPLERSISDGPKSTTSSTGSKPFTPTGSVVATAGSASPGSPGTGPTHSASKKPKLNLGSMPRFSPPINLMQGYTSMAIGTHNTGGGGTAVSSAGVTRSPSTAVEPFVYRGHGGISAGGTAPSSSSGSMVYMSTSGLPGSGGQTSTLANANANAGFAAALGMNSGALKVNGTPNGFRDSLAIESDAGGMRRASWTEDASRRQSIIKELQTVNVGDGA